MLTTSRGGSVRYVPWPPDKKVIDIGSFYGFGKFSNRRLEASHHPS